MPEFLLVNGSISWVSLPLMRIVDRMHLEHPFAGARTLRDLLRLRGFCGRAQARLYADTHTVN